jgi:hypothetical protein
VPRNAKALKCMILASEGIVTSEVASPYLLAVVIDISLILYKFSLNFFYITIQYIFKYLGA